MIIKGRPKLEKKLNEDELEFLNNIINDVEALVFIFKKKFGTTELKYKHVLKALNGLKGVIR